MHEFNEFDKAIWNIFKKGNTMNDTVNQDVATSVDPLAIPEFLKRQAKQATDVAQDEQKPVEVKAEDVK